MREVSQLFFPAHHLNTGASDSDSTYTPATQSTLDTLSFAPTTTIEATTATLSSTSSTITYCRPILEPPPQRIPPSALAIMAIHP